jgi:hypothetical protein
MLTGRRERGESKRDDRKHGVSEKTDLRLAQAISLLSTEYNFAVHTYHSAAYKDKET